MFNIFKKEETEKDNNLFFKYMPLKKVVKKSTNKNFNDNPFNILSQLNLK